MSEYNIYMGMSIPLMKICQYYWLFMRVTLGLDKSL